MSTPRRASSLPVSSHARSGRGAENSSPSASQRMFFELAETHPIELPKHLQYKSPLRSRPESAFANAYSRYMNPKTPPPEPTPNLGRPDYERIHGGDTYPYAETSSRVMDYLYKEKTEQPNFTPLAPEEGVRFDPEVEAMKEFAAKQGFPGASKYEQDTLDKSQFPDGENPREIAEKRRKEKFGIHPRTFRPVSEISARTFDDLIQMSNIWKRSMGIEEQEVKTKKMVRPSCVMEYVRHNTPILNRRGTPITPTGKERERIDEIRRRRSEKTESHFIPTPKGGDFTRGPGSDRPKGYRHAKESFNRERQMIKDLAERLTGKTPTKYSPAHMIQLATPMSVQRALAEEKALAEAEKRRQEEEEKEREYQQRQASGLTSPGAGVENNNNSNTTGRDDVSYTTRRLDTSSPTATTTTGRRGVSPSGSRARSPGIQHQRSKTPQGPQRPRYWR